MLDYTKTAVRETIKDFKKYLYEFSLITQIVYIAYLVYATIFSVFQIINGILLGVCIAYFLFFGCITKWGRDIDATRFQNAKKWGGEIFKWTKRLIRLLTLGVSIFALFQTTKAPTPLSIVMNAAMVVCWLLSVLLDIVFKIVQARVKFIVEGLEADWNDIVRPAKNVGDFFKKMTGKEVEPEKELTKTQLYLKEKTEEYQRENREKKRERHLLYRQSIKDKKEEKKREKEHLKASKKAERELLRYNKKHPLPPTDAEGK